MSYLYRRVIWPTLLSAGPRRGELAAIRIEKIDWVTGRVRIDRSYCRLTHSEKGTKTKSGIRDIWFSRQSLDAARHIILLRGNPTDGPLFVSKYAGVKSIAECMYAAYCKPVLEAAGIPEAEARGVITIHSTRHYAASMQHRRGLSSPARKKLLGHSRTGTDVVTGERGDVTGIYTHALSPEEGEARRVVQAIVDDHMPDEVEPLETAMRPHSAKDDPDYRREYSRAYYKKNSVRLLEDIKVRKARYRAEREAAEPVGHNGRESGGQGADK